MQTKRKIRIRVFRGLGSNRFRIYIYKYTVPGAASNHVVIFKAERSASLNHPKVQQCRSNAEAAAPRYLSRRETIDQITGLRLASSHNRRMAYAKLRMILPPNVTSHKVFSKVESKLLKETHALLSTCDNEKEELAIIASDLRHLNLGQNGDLDVSKFESFMSAVDTVVEMTGSGAHEKRHSQGDDVLKTTNVVYSSQFDSIEEVMEAAKKYLVEKNLVEGKDFFVPSIETLRLAFSPSHEGRALSATFIPRLNVKLVTRKKSGRANHSHSHYTSAQKKVTRFQLVDARLQLQKEEGDIESPVRFAWYYYVEVVSVDDKCSVQVSHPEAPGMLARIVLLFALV